MGNERLAPRLTERERDTGQDSPDTNNLQQPSTPCPHLFIAGAPRCGTSTLFAALSRHPQVAPCRVKEPNFLIPSSFPMKGFRQLQPDDGLEAYGALFPQGSGMRMDASATYLYAPGTAGRMRDWFPGSKVLFILRDPVPRIVSEFRFAQMMRVIPAGIGIEEYLALQRKQTAPHDQREPEHRALENGLYSRFLPRFEQALGRDRVKVVRTEVLSDQPEAVMRDICTFLDIDPKFYAGFTGERSNPAVEVIRPKLYAACFALEKRLAGAQARGRLGPMQRAIRRGLSRPLFKLATRPGRTPTLSPDSQRFLEAYYAEERAWLAGGCDGLSTG